jgi:hypothetical protein
MDLKDMMAMFRKPAQGSKIEESFMDLMNASMDDLDGLVPSESLSARISDLCEPRVLIADKQPNARRRDVLPTSRPPPFSPYPCTLKESFPDRD